MKLQEIHFSQSIRLLSTASPTRGNIYGVALLRTFEERYGFLQGPRNVSDFDPTKGILFLHGFFGDNIVIDRFQIFNDGVVCETRAPVEQADAFIEDALKWAAEKVNLEVGVEKGRIYNSHIVVHSSVQIEKKFELFSEFGSRLAKAIASYGGQNLTDFKLAGLRFFYDGSSLLTPKPTPFLFERRDGQPHDSGLYYSTAPLRTEDHLTLLKELESLLAD